MIDKIKEVLKSFKNQQFNMDSDSAIDLLAHKINETINENLEIERMKLSEQIIEHHSDGYIFESPDGGKTVYERDFGKTERKLVETDDPEPERYYDWMLWKFRQERKKRNS